LKQLQLIQVLCIKAKTLGNAALAAQKAFFVNRAGSAPDAAKAASSRPDTAFADKK